MTSQPCGKQTVPAQGDCRVQRGKGTVFVPLYPTTWECLRKLIHPTWPLETGNWVMLHRRRILFPLSWFGHIKLLLYGTQIVLPSEHFRTGMLSCKNHFVCLIGSVAFALDHGRNEELRRWVPFSLWPLWETILLFIGGSTALSFSWRVIGNRA